jgi:ABC-type phosphate/phosphonate transport system substrate-binding protein
MVDLVSQLREGVEKKYSRESLETMLLWGADEIERLRRELEARAEIVEIAKDLVALWQSPRIQGLPRADRNAAIEETRNRMIAAITALSAT